MHRDSLRPPAWLRSVAAAVVAAALVPGPAPARAAEPAAGAPGVRVILPAAPPDGAYGWSRNPVSIALVPTGPGRVLYRWGAGPGGWSAASGPVFAPEGKNVLSAVLVGPDGTASDVVESVVKTDLTGVSTPIAAIPASTATYTGGPGVAGGPVSVRVTVRATGGVELRRLGGANRYDVCEAVSQSNFTRADTVLVASGEKFPDALTASGLAGALKAPLLLTKRVELPPNVAAEMSRLGASRAIICGGPASVSPAVEASIRAKGLAVERIGGANRYAVAAGIADRLAALNGGAPKVFVARGDMFPDALSLGPIAFANRAPILLTSPGALNTETADCLARHRYASVYIAGGEVSVTPATARSIDGLSGAVVRWGGANRYETSVAVATNGVGLGANSWTYVAVSKGTDFADALCGGVGAGERGGVSLLTAPAPLSDPTARALETHVSAVRTVEVLGGEKSVTPATYEQVRRLLL